VSAAEVAAPLFTVREGRASDHALVFSSWLGSDRFSRQGQSCARVYQAEQERLVRDILARPGVTLRVACAPDDDDALLGWSVTAPAGPVPCIHYCYVKKGMRRLGVASALLGDLVTKRCEFTHQPVIHHKDFRPPSAWTFNPYRNHR
jgi:hypothetical protein